MPTGSPDAVLAFTAYGLTDVGRRRERNEDAFLIDADLQLYIVADGMGGHVGGGLASRLAVATIEEAIKPMLEPDATLEEPKAILRKAIHAAGQRIFQRAAENPALKGMGTTTVALWFRDKMAYLANVGDSRGYLVRQGRIRQLTIDHSLVGEQMRAGVISETDAKSHRLKNIITRSVGFQEVVEIDLDSRMARPGDLFVLCTDGLTNMIDDQEILSVVTHNHPKDAAHQLIDLANERGGDDNITILLVQVERAGDPASAQAEEEFEEPTIEI
ncbi:MAG: Stp1/IreP family PP2C-type Ser/Thr phosphatase [Deltaproteobacteria bacterium]|nr:Stp1/IreP family PP2C-type Ser/Thr phosphatase [Deltaproteobacteria bacterium]